MDFDWLYLFHDVYTSVDRHGILRLYESPTTQMGRMNELKSEHPSYFAALLEQGQTLVQLAEAGKLEEIHELLGELRQDELLFHFTDRMFTVACRSGQLHVCEYMLRRAFLPSSFPCGARPGQLASEVLQAAEGREEVCREGTPHTVRSDMESALSSFQSLLSGQDAEDSRSLSVRLPLPPACTLLWLTQHPALRCSVNALRPQDGYTPLHLAALSSLPSCCALLLSLGAEVNATGRDGRTPLGVAIQDGEAGQAHEQVVHMLKEAGGVATWQEALALVRQEAGGAASGGQGDVHAGGAAARPSTHTQGQGHSTTSVVLPGEGAYTVEDVVGMWSGLAKAAGRGGGQVVFDAAQVEPADRGASGGVTGGVPRANRPSRDMSAYSNTVGTARPAAAQSQAAAPPAS